MTERASVVRIVPMKTAMRAYNAIEVVIADLHLRCDLVCDRDIALAKRLADSHGAHWSVHESLQERVSKVLGEKAL